MMQSFFSSPNSQKIFVIKAFVTRTSVVERVLSWRFCQEGFVAKILSRRFSLIGVFAV